MLRKKLKQKWIVMYFVNLHFLGNRPGLELCMDLKVNTYIVKTTIYKFLTDQDWCYRTLTVFPIFDSLASWKIKYFNFYNLTHWKNKNCISVFESSLSRKHLFDVFSNNPFNRPSKGILNWKLSNYFSNLDVMLWKVLFIEKFYGENLDMIAWKLV